MCDPGLRQEIEQSIEGIETLRDNSPPLPDDWELVLELGKDGETGNPICSYYFVRRSTRCLFWLHEFDPESSLDGPWGVADDTHIRESASVPRMHRAKHTIRPGITSTVLVRSRLIVVVTS